MRKFQVYRSWGSFEVLEGTVKAEGPCQAVDGLMRYEADAGNCVVEPVTLRVVCVDTGEAWTFEAHTTVQIQVHMRWIRG